MSDSDRSSGSGRGGWWHTTPGVLTGVAAVLTALAGLLVAMQQVGLLDRGGATPPAATAAGGAVAPTDRGAPPTQDATPAGAYHVALPEGADVAVRWAGDALHRYRILSARVERQSRETLALALRVRLLNENRYDAALHSGTFRLVIDSVPRAPVSSVYEIVAGGAAKEADIVFEVPATARDLVLRVGDDATLRVAIEPVR